MDNYSKRKLIEEVLETARSLPKECGSIEFSCEEDKKPICLSTYDKCKELIKWANVINDAGVKVKFRCNMSDHEIERARKNTEIYYARKRAMSNG